MYVFYKRYISLSNYVGNIIGLYSRQLQVFGRKKQFLKANFIPYYTMSGEIINRERQLLGGVRFYKWPES